MKAKKKVKLVWTFPRRILYYKNIQSFYLQSFPTRQLFLFLQGFGLTMSSNLYSKKWYPSTIYILFKLLFKCNNDAFEYFIYLHRFSIHKWQIDANEILLFHIDPFPFKWQPGCWTQRATILPGNVIHRAIPIVSIATATRYHREKFTR